MTDDAPTPDFRLASGVPVYVETASQLPLVDIDLVFRRGASEDAVGGLSHIASQLVRRGTGALTAEAVNERIDALGASFGVGVHHSTVRFHATVIRRHLQDFLELLADLVLRPALREADFAHVQRQARADLTRLRDSDRALGARVFRRTLFEGHRFGRPIRGTEDSLDHIDLAAVRAHVAERVTASDLVIAAAGDVTADVLQPLLDRCFGDLPFGGRDKVAVDDPHQRPGRRVVIVDKPERTQTQLFIGCLGARLDDPSYHALLVSNTAFGGTFTSRLVHEVRSERGWSYGAGSTLGGDRAREGWWMWTHPSASQLLDCLGLQLEMLQGWLADGLTGDEIERAKSYLVNSHAFDRDTPLKRVLPRVDADVFSLPISFFDRYPDHVRGVFPAHADSAARHHLSADDLTVTVVATASPELVEGVRRRTEVDAVEVVPFSRV